MKLARIITTKLVKGIKPTYLSLKMANSSTLIQAYPGTPSCEIKAKSNGNCQKQYQNNGLHYLEYRPHPLRQIQTRKLIIYHTIQVIILNSIYQIAKIQKFVDIFRKGVTEMENQI
ncbi:Hypothetical_protein [Hexamita inflata]|uniref:Hypothetical_protein n=1 Tax=Hexamita inflata TaxID=28002 RepID=A0ABP1HTG0_9EUKA